MTCEYETVDDAARSAVLAFDVFQSDKFGLSGSAERHYLTVREATWHLWRDEGIDVKVVEGSGDEAFCVRGALHLVDGSHTYLAIVVSGSAGGRAIEPTCGSNEESSALTLAKATADTLLRNLSRRKHARTDQTVEMLFIRAGTQAHYENLRIGVGNIWEESYTADEGRPTHGLTAMLWLSSDASNDQRVRVHPGQTLHLFEYTIRVLSIKPHRVHLALERP